MRRQIYLASMFLICGLYDVALSADAFSAVTVPQATGFTTSSMSVDDTLREAKKLAASIPKAIDVPAIGNAAFILQVGSYNTAQVSQAGVRNVGLIAQSGSYNAAVIAQSGANHQAFIVQNGIGNTAISTQH